MGLAQLSITPGFGCDSKQVRDSAAMNCETRPAPDRKLEHGAGMPREPSGKMPDPPFTGGRQLSCRGSRGERASRGQAPFQLLPAPASRGERAGARSALRGCFKPAGRRPFCLAYTAWPHPHLFTPGRDVVTIPSLRFLAPWLSFGTSGCAIEGPGVRLIY